MDHAEVLQCLHDDEINFRLSCFYFGFDWGVMINEREISWVEGRADTALAAIAAIGTLLRSGTPCTRRPSRVPYETKSGRG